MDLTNPTTWISIGLITGIMAVAYVVTLWIAAVAWTARDIRERTDDQTLRAVSVLMVAVFFLPGLLLYMALRPQETRAEAFEREIEREAFLRDLDKQQTCPSCRRGVAEDFVACPYCTEELRTPCSSCTRSLAGAWTICPYCGADREAPAVAAAASLEPAAGTSAAPRPFPRRPLFREALRRHAAQPRA